jgi:hypothetical protein
MPLVPHVGPERADGPTPKGRSDSVEGVAREDQIAVSSHPNE